MHIALLVGFGAETVNPYLALETVAELLRRGCSQPAPTSLGPRSATSTPSTRGCARSSRDGISTIDSYSGAQIFEAVGLAPS